MCASARVHEFFIRVAFGNMLGALFPSDCLRSAKTFKLNSLVMTHARLTLLGTDPVLDKMTP